MTPRHTPVLGMILKGFPRISETFISNEILQLERLGFAIHIFSMRQPRETFAHDSVRQIQAPVDYLPETLLKPLPTLLRHNARLARSRPRIYAATLQTALRRFFRTRRPATVKHLLQAGYLVSGLLPGTGVVHLHAHFAHSPTSVALFAAQLSGLPFSFTAHAKDIYTSDPRQIREKIARSRFVVTCTEYNRRHLSRIAKNGATPIHRIYHGIDLSLFSADPSLHPPSPPFRLLTVARLTRKKGLKTVLEAVRQLVDRGLPIAHTLIGDGEARADILGHIRRLGLTGVTRWMGTRPHSEVLDHYRRSHLFILGCEVAPNGDRDGIPNVIVESMAMGVPVVATRVSAIPEIVVHERTGLLVPPQRPGPMAHAMHRLLTDEALRRRLIPAARKRVHDAFDNRRLIRELAEIHRAQGIGRCGRGGDALAVPSTRP